ncbi:lipopolysaccharide biosynthesis protein [Bacillus sp. BA3]|nr:lipopolysaccharide biosynthesis protein [Bacillus sp. BA3]
MSSSIGVKIGKATKWSAITEIMAKVVVPISNMVLVRFLDPEMFGVVATIIMVVSFTELFTDAGFQKYLVQHRFNSEEELNKATTVAFWTNVVVSIFLWVIIVIFSKEIATIIGNPGKELAIVIACLGLPITAFSSIQNARFKRKFDYKTLFNVRMFAIMIPFVVTIPIAFITNSYWAMIIGSLAVNFSNALILTIRSEWKPSLFFDFAILKNMLQFSIWSMFDSILVWLINWGDIFIVSSILSSYYLGLYKTSMTTIDGIIGIVSATTVSVLFSSLSRLQNDPQQFKNVYYSFSKLSSTLLIPMGLGLFIYKDLVVSILLGNAWSEASTFVGIWGLISALGILFNSYNGTVLIAMGKPKVSVIVQILQIAVIIPAVYISVNISYDFLTYTRAFVRIVGMLIHIFIVWKLFGILFSRVLKDLLPVIISSGVMAFAGVIFVNSSNSEIVSLVSILGCVVIYFTVLMIFPSMRLEIQPYLKKMMGKKNKKITLLLNWIFSK